MKLIGFDTATTTCSVALWADDGVAAHRCVAAAGRHAEILVPLLREVAAGVGVGLVAIDAFAVTVGPGSFTGIRIGLATARGLALAAGRPLIGLSTLEVVAAGVPESERDGPILASLDARRGKLYVQLFDHVLRPLCEPHATVIDALPSLLNERVNGRSLIVTGTGSELAIAALPRAIEARQAIGSRWPDARVLARCAADRAQSGTHEAAGMVRPLYLREPGARRPARPVVQTSTLA